MVACPVSPSARSLPRGSPTAPKGNDELDRTLAALRWSADDLDPDWPPHVAFTGNDHPMLATRTRARLADLDYDVGASQSLMREYAWTTLQLFWPRDEHTIHTRDPFPVGGVVEDPATGAAAAVFGGYLLALGRVSAPRRITVLHGEDMGRPGELSVDVDPADLRVTVSGAAVRQPTAASAS